VFCPERQLGGVPACSDGEEQRPLIRHGSRCPPLSARTPLLVTLAHFKTSRNNCDIGYPWQIVSSVQSPPPQGVAKSRLSCDWPQLCTAFADGITNQQVLHQALAHPASTKTYVAVVRGSGEAHVGRGWFTVSRPVKDDKNVLREASTRFLFVRGGDAPDPRCCLVLAQPSTGR